MKKKNKTVKEFLNCLKRDKIISEGEYQRMWNDYKQLHKKDLKKVKLRMCEWKMFFAKKNSYFCHSVCNIPEHTQELNF